MKYLTPKLVVCKPDGFEKGGRFLPPTPLWLRHWMAELQADNEERTDFDGLQDIAKLWIQLPNKHSTVRNRALQVLVKFGSTYVC